MAVLKRAATGRTVLAERVLYARETLARLVESVDARRAFQRGVRVGYAAGHADARHELIGTPRARLEVVR